ncbi:hypothetical protein [Halococcus sp. AFM35]
MSSMPLLATVVVVAFLSLCGFYESMAEFIASNRSTERTAG